MHWRVIRTSRREINATRNSAYFQVLGAQVDAVQIPDVIARMEQWIVAGARGWFIAATGMHG